MSIIYKNSAWEGLMCLETMPYHLQSIDNRLVDKFHTSMGFESSQLCYQRQLLDLIPSLLNPTPKTVL
jgi:hypothetical protein